MGLPDSLQDLVPLFEPWAIADVSRRVDRIGSANASDLRNLTGSVLPRIDAIEAYLDAFGDRPLDDPARRLLSLAESTLEAQTELDSRQPSEDTPG